jgi:hypothetical protein
MKIRSLIALAGLAIGFAVPSIAQDAMKVITADELVWKEHPVFKGGFQSPGGEGTEPQDRERSSTTWCIAPPQESNSRARSTAASLP